MIILGVLGSHIPCRLEGLVECQGLLQIQSRKLAPQFVGSFPIFKVINSSAVRLRLLATMRHIHPMYHIFLLKSYVVSTLSSPALPPPPLRLVDGGEVYTLWHLLDVRRQGRGLDYLMDWEGYSPEEWS